jgi:hypothetical protein
MKDAGYEPSSVGEYPTFNWRFKIRRPTEDAKWLEIGLREELGIGRPTTARELDWMCWYVLASLKSASARDWLKAAKADGMDEADFVASVVRLAEAGSVERDGDVWKIRREQDCE